MLDALDEMRTERHVAVLLFCFDWYSLHRRPSLDLTLIFHTLPAETERGSVRLGLRDFFTEFFPEMQSDVMMLRTYNILAYMQKELIAIQHAAKDMCVPAPGSGIWKV